MYFLRDELGKASDPEQLRILIKAMNHCFIQLLKEGELDGDLLHALLVVAHATDCACQGIPGELEEALLSEYAELTRKEDLSWLDLPDEIHQKLQEL